MSLCHNFGAAVSLAQRGEAPQRGQRVGRARGMAALVDAEIALERASAANAAIAPQDNNQDDDSPVEITERLQRLLEFIDADARRRDAADADLNDASQAAAVPPPPIMVDDNAGS